jgi:hypothetical protein
VWGVAIRSPDDEDQVLALVTIEGGAVAGYGGVTGKLTAMAAHALAIGATALEAESRAQTLFALGARSGCALAEKLGWSAMWVAKGPGGNDAPPNIVVTTTLRGTIQLQSTGGNVARPAVQTCPGVGGK